VGEKDRDGAVGSTAKQERDVNSAGVTMSLKPLTSKALLSTL
jgi:hypothetical protein